MKRAVVIVSFLLTVALTGIVTAQDMTPYEEIITKVNEAVKFLEENGEAGLSAFNEPEGPWVWDNTYIFVYSCENDIMAAHPDNTLIGHKLTEFVDAMGIYFSMGLCEIANSPNGGWGEYWWNRLGGDVPERKVSYMLKVPGQPYEVGAGMYDPEITLEELNGLIE